MMLEYIMKLIQTFRDNQWMLVAKKQKSTETEKQLVNM